MHRTQKVLLKRLAQQNNQKYAALTRGYNFENNIVFHLNQLLENQFIEKEDNTYAITPTGIKETFFCGFIVHDGHGNYLLKSHPTAKINFYNFPSGRPMFGEPMEAALVRLFKENTGIEIPSVRFEYKSLHAKIVKTLDGESLFDDGQVMFQVEITPTEKESMKLLEGVKWYSIQEIKALDNCWPEIKMCLFDDEVVPYASYEIVSNYKL